MAMGGGDILAKKFVVFEAQGLDAILKDTQTYNDALATTTERLKKIKEAIANGSYAKLAKDAVALRQANDAVAKSARAIDLKANFGNFTAGLIRANESMTGLANAAKIGLAAVGGSTMAWVTAGMRGTVEADQLERSFTRMSRAIAGAFKPAIDSFVRSAGQLAGSIDGMSRSEQDSLRITTEWTVGILGGVSALKMLSEWAVTAAINFQALRESQIGGFLGKIGLAGLGVGVAADAFGEGPRRTSGGRLWEETRAIGGSALTGAMIGSMVPVIGTGIGALIGTGVGAIGIAIKEATDGKPEKDASGQKLALNQTGFGEIGSAWDRLAQEAIQVSAMELLTQAIKDNTDAHKGEKFDMWTGKWEKK